MDVQRTILVNSGGNLKYDKVCDVETRILKSYGDTVRVEYEPQKMITYM